MLLVCGCGRFGFDASIDARGSGDDAASDAVTAAACKASYELCDDFEATAFDSVWTLDSPNISLDTTIAHRGGQSMHVFSDLVAAGKPGEFSLDETATLALNDPTFYVRTYVRLGALPLDNMRLIKAAQISGAPREDGVYINPGEMTVFSQFSGASQSTNENPPTDTWFCVLWTVHRSTTSGSLALAGDPPALTLPNTQTDGAPPISILGFGIEFSATTQMVDQPRIDVWIDDVIVANTPITCAD
ncbi:MAG: hypothetical protein ABI704_23205 [Kofleriaceae bacterium]